MTTATEAKIKAEITTALQTYAGISPVRSKGLLPLKSLQGKLYELAVLAEICERLTVDEGLTIRLSGGSSLMFRQKGGPIVAGYPFLEILKKGSVIAELHIDIYFSTLSFHQRGGSLPTSPGDFHELDIAVIKPGRRAGLPTYEEIYIAIECKNWKAIDKSVIRQILGFRRELGILCSPLPTIFKNWPTDKVPNDPSSVQIFYCSDNYVTKFSQNCSIFGVLLIHYDM